jgi:hypothetical protein
LPEIVALRPPKWPGAYQFADTPVTSPRSHLRAAAHPPSGQTGAVEIRGEGFTGIEFPRTSPPGDAIVVQLGDAPFTEARVRDLFEQAGVPIRLELWPVGPSLVGQLLSVRSAALPDRAVFWEDGRVAVARSWSGTLVVWLGRVADVGERYGPWSDVTGPGEPFEHENILGRTLGEVRPRLAPYEVTILAGDPPRTRFRPMPLPEAGGPFDSHVIAFAQATSWTALFLTLHPA